MLSGGQMSGCINTKYGAPGINFRTGHSSYNAMLAYYTPGNEALVLGLHNAVTSFIVKSGVDLSDKTDWQSTVIGTPSIQVKGQSLYVNGYIANGASPEYNLYVGGTSYVTGNITAASFTKSGGTSSQFLKADGSVDSNSYSLSSHTHSYLPLSGGTLTGQLRAPLYIMNNGTTYLDVSGSTLIVSPDGTNRYTVWHSGNDGANSGLDADTIDGYHASKFLLDPIWNEEVNVSSEGWYRVARLKTQDMARGITEFFLAIYGGSWSPNYAKYTIYGNWSRANAYDIHVESNSFSFGGLRTTYEGDYIYIEVYFKNSISGAKLIVPAKNKTNNVNVGQSWEWFSGDLSAGGGTEVSGTAGNIISGHTRNSNITSSGFAKISSNNSYVLLGGGGHKAVSDFATSSHTHSYLPLSGGTITSASTVPLGLTTSSNYCFIRFGASSTNKGEVGYYHNGPGGVGEMYMQVYGTGNPTLSISENGNGYIGSNVIYHSGNLPAYPTKASWNYDDVYIKIADIGSQSVNFSTSSGKLKYTSQLTTKETLDSFHEAGYFKVTTWNGNSEETSLGTSYPGTNNGIVLDGGWTGATYGFQLAIDDDPNYFIALRQRGTNGWASWKKIPMGDGTNASGTWGISITGNAATATTATTANSVAWANVSGKPSTFTPSTHTHDYLPLSGGDLTGPLGINNEHEVSWNISQAEKKLRFLTTTASTSATGSPGRYHSGVSFMTGYCGFQLSVYGGTGSKDLYFRHCGDSGEKWGSWYILLNSGNYDSYTVKKDGTGATGTWGINISGSAASATSAETATTSTVLLTNNTSQSADACYNEAPGLRFWRYNGTSSTTGQSGGDGWILSWSWNSGSVGGQIYLDDNPSRTMCIRGFNNDANKTFTTWATFLHTGNHIALTNSEIDTIMV